MQEKEKNNKEIDQNFIKKQTMKNRQIKLDKK